MIKNSSTLHTNDIIYYLHNRNLIDKITDEKALRSTLKLKSIVLYCGFDPTADSLHIGHLVPLLCLKQFQIFGHKPIILLGGATGLIGDPSFKKSKRKFNSLSTIQEWTKQIKTQVYSLIKFDDERSSYQCIINNYTWFSAINVLTFFREIGKFFSINKMINKNIIKSRLMQNNHGISYTEFSYNLMQSYDFAYLYKNHQAILQIGGSDQWGNIVSGIDLIRRMYKTTAYGLTVPLLTNTNNIKFGKTEKNTIWLDPKKTSPYKFYQYWINLDDKTVYRFLKFFTNINIEEINTMHTDQLTNAYSYPKAKVILAEEMTKLVHGQYNLKVVQHITHSLFYGKIQQLTLEDFHQLALDGIPSIVLKKNITLQQALVETKLATSKTQARYFIESNAITINQNKQLITVKYEFKDSDRLFNNYTLLKRGKKNYCLIQWD